ncbi:MAG: T9SS C-terminal target domain-containing protein, partial [Bacteroidota bacterium]
MKRTAINLACLTLGILISLNAYSEKRIDERGGGTTGNTKSVSAGCVPATSSTELELNNVRSLIHTGGDMWWDLQGAPKYEVPKGSGKTALFAGGIWIGGVDVNGQLRSCFVRYRAAGVDYWPGPLVASGPEQGSTTSDVCEAYDRHFNVTRNEVAQFRTFINAKLTNDLTILESEEYEGYQTPTIIQEWPAHGDITAGYDWHMAPFFDADFDDAYNPENGDYPFYDLDGELPCGTTRELRKPRLYGDQTLWWVYNDRGNVHLESNGAAIGMEIRAQAFAFSTNDELNNMTFGNYELINRSTYTLYDTYFGVWTDADMGDPYDDYVGTDVARGLGFLYNGDEEDGTGSTTTYGKQPPAVGVDFFEGPYQDADGEDNTSFWDPATGNINCNRAGAVLTEGSINGLNFEDGIVDNERWGMRRFIYFNNCNGDMCDPDIAIEYYQYLKGFWKDGTPLTFGGNGHGGTRETEFMFPGITDKCNWGTKGVDPNYSNPLGWSEEAEGTDPDDRRFVQSSGPFTLEPGAVNDITVGMVWARATSGGAYASVAEVQRADDKAQKLFENCFKVVDGPDAPELTIIELENQLIFHIYNKKGSNNYKVTPEDYVEKDPFIVCPESDSDCDIYYRFEGYQVFQLKDVSCSVSDIYDPDKSKLVFQCDIENFDENGEPIGRLVNYTWDEDMEANIPQMMVDGKNEGIKHTFVITDDQFAAGVKTLVNHKKYYYIALAYAYNNYKPYSQSDPNSFDGQKSPFKAGRKGASGSIKVYEAIPHVVDPANGGTILNSSYGDGPEIVQLEGHGSGGNELDLTDETKQRIMAGAPWKVDSIVYKEGYGPINVKVIDPLNVPKAELMLAFDSTLVVYIHRNKIVR